MKREKTEITSKDQWLNLRLDNVNSTEAATLLNMNKYQTILEMHYQKKDRVITKIEETERMRLGTRFEAAIAAEAAEQNKWEIRPRKFYEHLPELQIGSSYDYDIIGPNGDVIALLECKNVDGLVFRNEWEVDDNGNIESTPYIECQAQTQMLVSGVNKLFIAAVVGGNSLKILEREPDHDIQSAIIEKAKEFWASVRAGKAPDADYSRDAEFIIASYKTAKEGKIIDARGDKTLEDLAREYRRFGDISKEADSAQKAIKAQLLEKIGDAEKVLGDSFSSISCGLVKASEYTVKRDEYRTFKINWKKNV